MSGDGVPPSFVVAVSVYIVELYWNFLPLQLRAFRLRVSAAESLVTTLEVCVGLPVTHGCYTQGPAHVTNL